MCGIFGIYGNEHAAPMTHLGLYALQHRGQESSGIVAVDREFGARAIKRMGLVSEALAAPDVNSMRGDIAIGHTRYSTAGSSTIENAQPVLARFRDGHIALAHNGNLTNASELRRELEDQGAIFSSTMDSEVLVHRIARSSSVKPEERLADALQGVEGAYCLVVVIGNTLLAARDPRGWRPLVIGRLGDSTIFASESCALDLLGATLEREVEPGEIITLDESGMRSISPFEKKELKKCVFEYVYFSRPDSQVFGGSVDRARRELGRRLARDFPAPSAQLVFSVPDSSNSAALGFAEESGLPL
ncbi:MAG: class II glutamine amidotransferase, partial [Gemmatimonadales bacterium]